PLGFKRQLRPSLLCLWDGHEVGAFASLFNDVIGDPIIRETEMPSRFREGGIDDWIFDDSVRHVDKIMQSKVLCRRPSSSQSAGRRFELCCWSARRVEAFGLLLASFVIRALEAPFIWRHNWARVSPHRASAVLPAFPPS